MIKNCLLKSKDLNLRNSIFITANESVSKHTSIF
jgi:hypothetical protein